MYSILRSSLKQILLRSNQSLSVLRAVATTTQQQQHDTTITIGGKEYKRDHMTNIRNKIIDHVGVNLHHHGNHPINLIKQRIVNYIQTVYQDRVGHPTFASVDTLPPVVTPQQNFDSLLVSHDHVSRLPSDTFYINSESLLRTHTSAHQAEVLRAGADAFLLTGDVYRKDQIDSNHYPVFHQMEGARIYTHTQLHNIHTQRRHDDDTDYIITPGRNPRRQEKHDVATVTLLENDLKDTVEGVVECLFGSDVEKRWVSCYFPFTHPSWELEILQNDEWVEVLGCGIIEQQILEGSGAGEKVGWAFGLGLERLAMILYRIPDIRLFWSHDQRFLSQFVTDDPQRPITFKPFSKYPPIPDDVSFWLPENGAFSLVEFHQLIRDIAGDVIESVCLIDEYRDSETARVSHCYRLMFRHMERTLTQTEVNEMRALIDTGATTLLGVEIRNK